jgi:hypothetical protein
MVRLDQLEKAMRPNFIWDRNGLKPLQTNEEYEGAKDLARMVFVGLAEMYGFDQVDVMNYLDMEYDSFRNKVSAFRSNYREALKRVKNESIFLQEDPIKRFYLKVALCLNSIKFATSTNPFVKIEDWITYE